MRRKSCCSLPVPGVRSRTTCSQWADYGCNGLYLDEQTSGYTIAHNVLINCPTNVAQNRAGTNTIRDNGENPEGAQDTIATAGIEPAYADIKETCHPACRVLMEARRGDRT